VFSIPLLTCCVIKNQVAVQFVKKKNLHFKKELNRKPVHIIMLIKAIYLSQFNLFSLHDLRSVAQQFLTKTNFQQFCKNNFFL